MLASSSFAFTAVNNDRDKEGGRRNEQTTGSINTEGRALSAKEREICITNPSDAKCQHLGGEINHR